jgi:hypothetical protein
VYFQFDTAARVPGDEAGEEEEDEEVSKMSDCDAGAEPVHYDNETPYDLSPGEDGHVGMCVILNFINFTQLSKLEKREGSQLDGRKITHTFK